MSINTLIPGSLYELISHIIPDRLENSFNTVLDFVNDLRQKIKRLAKEEKRKIKISEDIIINPLVDFFTYY
jgi:hypothetical protein